jgi:hypothetical protein
MPPRRLHNIDAKKMLPDLDHFWFLNKLARVRDFFPGVFLTAYVVCDQIRSKLLTSVMDNHQNHNHLVHQPYQQ